MDSKDLKIKNLEKDIANLKKSIFFIECEMKKMHSRLIHTDASIKWTDNKISKISKGI
jgi:hypothetical protein